MVGPLQKSSTSGSIAISRPGDDAKHNANYIKTGSQVINGHKTDFVIEPFRDRIFILVTQSQKMGTLISAEKETVISGAEAFGISVVMGKREVGELEVCARQIISMMDEDGCSKALLLGIGLKDHSMGTICKVVETVKQLKVW